YAGDTALTAEIPAAVGTADRFGRALGREHLDTLLLSHAAQAGAHIMQPAKVTGLERSYAGAYRCTLAGKGHAALEARHIIAAYGSWERSAMLDQHSRPARRAGDLFAFKAHFKGGGLPDDLMPLMAFPGGYGGMVHTNNTRISFSCCI